MANRLLICVYLCSSVAYSDLLIRDVTVIDVANGRLLGRRSILIRGNKIAEVASEVHGFKDVEVVNAAGKFLIPGLWDMHVHLRQREQLPRYVASGITGVR